MSGDQAQRLVQLERPPERDRDPLALRAAVCHRSWGRGLIAEGHAMADKGRFTN